MNNFPVKTLRNVAKALEIEGSSSMRKDELLKEISKNPTVKNPKTGRYVKRSGKIGKSIMDKAKSTSPRRRKKSTSPPRRRRKSTSPPRRRKKSTSPRRRKKSTSPPRRRKKIASRRVRPILKCKSAYSPRTKGKKHGRRVRFNFRASSPTSGYRNESPQDDSYGYVVYTMAGCGYCTDVKNILKKNGIKPKTVSVNSSNMDNIYSKIDSITKKYRYFPIVIKNGKFVGGLKEIQKMDKNKLKM